MSAIQQKARPLAPPRVAAYHEGAARRSARDLGRRERIRHLEAVMAAFVRTSASPGAGRQRAEGGSS